MEKDILEKVHGVLYEMLTVFDKVCKELNTPYFLINGSLLGAIRHDGFIPWDDDLDVSMMREDYERFLQEAPALLGREYYLQHWKNDAAYGHVFAKLRKENTVYLESTARNVGTHCGIYIDIIPFDVCPDSERARKKQGKTLSFLRRCVLVQCGYRPWETPGNPVKAVLKRIGYLPIVLYAKLHSKEKAVQCYEGVARAYNATNESCCFANSGAYEYSRTIVPRAYFGKRQHLFCQSFFPVPEQAEAYLTKVYGDYLQLPPEDQRENRHNVIKIEFM